jgi:hypothetical protein
MYHFYKEIAGKLHLPHYGVSNRSLRAVSAFLLQ